MQITFETIKTILIVFDVLIIILLFSGYVWLYSKGTKRDLAVNTLFQDNLKFKLFLKRTYKALQVGVVNDGDINSEEFNERVLKHIEDHVTFTPKNLNKGDTHGES